MKPTVLVVLILALTFAFVGSFVVMTTVLVRTARAEAQPDYKPYLIATPDDARVWKMQYQGCEIFLTTSRFGTNDIAEIALGRGCR